MPETVTFDHYEVLTRDDGSLYELGRGAMGITYKAFDTNLRVPVALKVINTQTLNSDLSRQRFIREARSAAKLRHRHVASVFHLGTEGDAYFYAMEFIDGETVEALVKRQGPLTPALALRITLQVTRALGAAQQHALVHRDIKPSNLMLVREDEELVVKVIDFGLAKTAAGEADEDAATVSIGGFVGTPHFASPEQLEDQEIDVRSDIYSLGVTLWYMLSGHTPFAGSMAQVMSQHLTKEPPFDKLAGLPPPVAGLLGKMLAKTPNERFQNPTELRQAIERCVEELSGQGGAATTPATMLAEEDFATVLDESGAEQPTLFEPGTILGGRYEIRQALGETNAGRIFRASDRERKVEVRLLVLPSDLTNDAALHAQIEREVERIVPVKQANLLRISGVERIGQSSFVVIEWTSGFTLLELLRSRRELNVAETLLLLKQAAAGIDFAASAGLKRLDLALHQMFVHFNNDPVPAEERLRLPVTDWSEFQLKLNPLGITRELSASETWAGGQTIVSEALPQRGGAVDSRQQYISSLASIAYELLGGALSPLGAAAMASTRFSPLANLTEEGNEVIKKAMFLSGAYPTATAFFTELESKERAAVEMAATKHDTRIAGPAPGAPKSPFALPQSSKRIPVGFFGGILTVVAVGGAMYMFLRHSEEVGPPPPSDLLSLTSPDPAADPNAAAEAKPVENLPVPAATPEPKPSRDDYLRAAINSSEVLERDGDLERAIAGWLRVIKQFPETEIGKVRLEMLLDKVRTARDPLPDEEFLKIRQLLQEAADREILAAQMLLGQELREREPKASFHWFKVAADKGVAAAQTQVGLMLSNGHGTERDLKKAVEYFELAADQDPAAKAALAECYLHGRGVEKDEAKAIQLLEEASKSGIARAMNRLAFCYHKGVGINRNFDEALRLFRRAADLGLAEAVGNLGVLYMNGDGVPANPNEAVEFFRKGAEMGDSNSMFLFARCLENGIGIGASRLQAEAWYRKAAEAGDARAAEWLEKNKVQPKAPR